MVGESKDLGGRMCRTLDNLNLGKVKDSSAKRIEELCKEEN